MISDFPRFVHSKAIVLDSEPFLPMMMMKMKMKMMVDGAEELFLRGQRA